MARMDLHPPQGSIARRRASPSSTLRRSRDAERRWAPPCAPSWSAPCDVAGRTRAARGGADRRRPAPSAPAPTSAEAAGARPRTGADLQELVLRYYNPVRADGCATLPMPLVTAVNGVAAGIGCSFALHGRPHASRGRERRLRCRPSPRSAWCPTGAPPGCCRAWSARRGPWRWCCSATPCRPRTRRGLGPDQPLRARRRGRWPPRWTWRGGWPTARPRSA